MIQAMDRTNFLTRATGTQVKHLVLQIVISSYSATHLFKLSWTHLCESPRFISLSSPSSKLSAYLLFYYCRVGVEHCPSRIGRKVSFYLPTYLATIHRHLNGMFWIFIHMTRLPCVLSFSPMIPLRYRKALSIEILSTRRLDGSLSERSQPDRSLHSQ